MAELKVKNESGGPLSITHTNGVDTVDFGIGAEEMLGVGFLLADSFKEELAKGSLRFVASPVTKDTSALARMVFPALIEELASPMLSLHGSMRGSKQTLGDLRSGYNKAHQVTSSLLSQAGATAKGPRHLHDGADHWLAVKPEQDAVDAAYAAIEAHQAVDVPGDMPFDQWYEELLELQSAYEQAQQALAVATASYIDDFKPVLDALDAAATDFEAAALDPGIGSEIPPW